MRGDELLDKLEYIDADLIEEADRLPSAKKFYTWVKWAAAACIGIILFPLAVTFYSISQGAGAAMPDNMGQSAGAAMPGNQYTKSADIQYHQFSDQREALELEHYIPVMADYPEFFCEAAYNDDGSIYCLTLSWTNSDSTLEVIASPQKIEAFDDSVDENKTMTFQNDTGWYQIIRSYGDRYEDVNMLADWLRENAIDFERFTVYP